MLRRAGLLGCVVLALEGPARDSERFRLDPGASRVTVHVGRSGVLGLAGHDHEVVAPALDGQIVLTRAEVSRSKVWLRFDARALTVTGKGGPAKDVPEVQRIMLSDRVLDAGRYPTITFESRTVSVTGGGGDRLQLRIAGTLTLRGVTQPASVLASVRLGDAVLTAEGRTSIRQTDFGIKPVTAGAGTVRVKNDLEIRFFLLARRE